MVQFKLIELGGQLFSDRTIFCNLKVNALCIALVFKAKFVE